MELDEPIPPRHRRLFQARHLRSSCLSARRWSRSESADPLPGGRHEADSRTDPFSGAHFCCATIWRPAVAGRWSRLRYSFLGWIQSTLFWSTRCHHRLDRVNRDTKIRNQLLRAEQLLQREMLPRLWSYSNLPLLSVQILMDAKIVLFVATACLYLR